MQLLEGTWGGFFEGFRVGEQDEFGAREEVARLTDGEEREERRPPHLLHLLCRAVAFGA